MSRNKVPTLPDCKSRPSAPCNKKRSSLIIINRKRPKVECRTQCLDSYYLLWSGPFLRRLLNLSRNRLRNIIAGNFPRYKGFCRRWRKCFAGWTIFSCKQLLGLLSFLHQQKRRLVKMIRKRVTNCSRIEPGDLYRK